MLLCVEDFKQFNSPSMDASSPPYFLFDSCCSISDVSELVCFSLLKLLLVLSFIKLLAC